MSTHVRGFIPPDETWHKMKAVWDACLIAGVSIPREVDEFFGASDPSDCGRMIDIPHSVYAGQMINGFQVEVDKLPKEVKVIRFYNSY